MEVTVLRRGQVSYLAGYEQTRHEIGASPVYRTARVEEYTLDGADRHHVYYPPTAAARTTDGGVELPASLLAEVCWE